MIQKLRETRDEWNSANNHSEFQDAQGKLRSQLSHSSSEWEPEIMEE